MQNFFVAASDTVKPLFLGFNNPFTAVLKSYSAKSAEETRAADAVSLQHMARDLESSQPSLAAELRYFASRS